MYTYTYIYAYAYIYIYINAYNIHTIDNNIDDIL